MMSFPTVVRYSANVAGHRSSFWMLAPCLLLLSAAPVLRAQSGTEDATCSPTINPSYCNDCYGAALGAGLACALGGDCEGGGPMETFNNVFADCMQNITPPPPPPPTPTSQPSQCGGGGGEVVRAPRSALQRRFPPATLRPAATGLDPCGITFLDPVPDLQNGNFIVTDPEVLATMGTRVGAIAADSAARVVVVIPAASIGDSVTLTLTGDGSLSSIGGAENSSEVTLTAQDTGSRPMAFAVYSAPSNFSRGASTGDDIIDYRTVTFQATLPDNMEFTTPLIILRPPLVLVHGLWGDRSDWYNFTPLTNDPLRSFFVSPANYNYDLHGAITAAQPSYTPKILNSARGNALGFDFAAPYVLIQIQEAIVAFRQAQRTLSSGVAIDGAAAAQADVIAHSMGGTVARTVVNLPSYAGSDSFGVGVIHKLITIGTPHKGSPLATDLLQDSPCMRDELADNEHIAFYTVSPPGPSSPHGCGIYTTLWCGGTGDLQPGSDALGRIDGGNGLTVPTALIAATTTLANTLSLDGTFAVVPIFLRWKCSSDPVAQRYTTELWQTEFGEANDGVVGLSSQLAGFGAPPANGNPNPVTGLIHSSSLDRLGFTPPGELDSATDASGNPTSAAGIQALVIQFLNEAPSGQDFHQLN